MGKNNAHFVDDAYNRFIDELSIGQWLWDEDLMGSAPPGFVSRILAQQESRIDAGLIGVGSNPLTAPPEDEFWKSVKAQLGKRAMIAHANERVAEGLRDDTVALEEKINTYLEERR